MMTSIPALLAKFRTTSFPANRRARTAAAVPAEISVAEPRVMLSGNPIFVHAEPENDVAAGAVDITGPGTQLFQSRLEVGDADDWYKFNLAQRQPFAVATGHTSTLITLVLKDAYGNNIEVSRQWGEQRDAAIERELPAGDYFLRVVRTNPTDTGTPTDYKLKAIFDVGPNDNEPENDTRFGATPITASGQQSVNSRLSFNDVDDYYKFTLNQQQTVNSTLTSYGASATLVLKDAYGQNIDRVRTPLAGSASTHQTLQPGTYFLRVVRTTPRLFDQTFEYKLDVEFNSPSGGGFGGILSDDEPGNDVRDGAGVIPSSGIQAAGGQLSEWDVDDYWTFNLDQGQRVVTTLRNFSVNLTLVLKDEWGNNIEVSRNGGLNSEHIDRYLPAGRYFLRVVRANPTAVGLVSDYVLESNFTH